MPYWVHGRDSATGEPTDPFFSAATTSDVARAEASAQGMIVESIEPHVDDEPAGTATRDLPMGEAFVPGLLHVDDEPAETTTRDMTSKTPSFEFTEEQNNVIKSVAFHMKVVAIVLVLVGIVSVSSGFVIGAAPMIPGVLLVIIGGLTHSAAFSFGQAAQTRGRNIEDLMDAIGSLKYVYAIQAWVIGIALLMIALALLLAALGPMIALALLLAALGEAIKVV